MKEIKMHGSKETAAILGVTPRTLMNYTQAGTIAARKIGGKWRYTEEAIEEFMRGRNDPKEGIMIRLGSLLGALDDLYDYSFAAMTKAQPSGFEQEIGQRIGRIMADHVRPMQKLMLR